VLQPVNDHRRADDCVDRTPCGRLVEPPTTPGVALNGAGGAAGVVDAIASGATMSVVNWAEVLSNVAADGAAASDKVQMIR